MPHAHPRVHSARKVGAARLPAGNRPDHDKRLLPRRDRIRQRGIRRLVGEILLTRKEPQKRPALLRDVIANRPAQHRIASLERIEHRTLRNRTLYRKLHLTPNIR